MNRTIRRAGTVTLLLVMALLMRLTWLQTVDGEALADNEDNRRNAIERYAHPFGDISVGGETGTAQHGVDNSGTPYAWFTSFGETDSGRKVAVAYWWRTRTRPAPRSAATGRRPPSPGR